MSEIIQVYKVSYGKDYYYTDIAPDYSDLENGEIVTEEEMSREEYESLPEFRGF